MVSRHTLKRSTFTNFPKLKSSQCSAEPFGIALLLSRCAWWQKNAVTDDGRTGTVSLRMRAEVEEWEAQKIYIAEGQSLIYPSHAPFSSLHATEFVCLLDTKSISGSTRYYNTQTLAKTASSLVRLSLSAVFRLSEANTLQANSRHPLETNCHIINCMRVILMLSY